MHSNLYYTTKLLALSNGKIAQKRQREIRGIRGVRGVSNSDLIALINESDWPTLPDDSEILHQLFGTAHEDGLLAIALLAVSALEEPESALILAERWLPYLDDSETADFLGHLVIGPSSLAIGESISERISLQESNYAVRAELMACLAALPEPAKGVCAAGLRRKFQVDQITFVEAPIFERIHQAVLATMKSDSPIVKKSLRMVIRCWSSWNPSDVELFFQTHYPNWPNWMKDSWKKGSKIHRRRVG